MITPLDITKQEFRKTMRGYDVQEVKEFLEILANSYKELLISKDKLTTENDNFKVKLSEYVNIDKILRETLITVKKTAEEISKNAKKEAELIINTAKIKSEKIILEGFQKKEKILSDIENLKSQRKLLLSKMRAFLTTQYELLKQENLEIDYENNTKIRQSS